MRRPSTGTFPLPRPLLLGHTHFDHALDAPAIARRDGCNVYGSGSVARLLGVHGLGNQAVVVEPYRTYEIGPFTVTFVPSRHSKPSRVIPGNPGPRYLFDRSRRSGDATETAAIGSGSWRRREDRRDERGRTMSTTGDEQEGAGRPTSQARYVAEEQPTDGQEPETTVGRGAGWRAFAGIMLVIVGFLNFIDALVALTNASYYRHVANVNNIYLPATNNIHAWGWVELIFSIILVIAGLSVLAMEGAVWSRFVGVVFAGLNMLFQLAWLAHFPFWSFTMIIVDILIIYGLIRRVEEYEVD